MSSKPLVKQEVLPPAPVSQAETKPDSIQWVEVTCPLNKLRPFEQNPRTITKDQFEKLKASLIRNGQFAPLLATKDLRLAGGHQRLKAMRELGWTECRITVPDQPVSDRQFVELLILHNHSNGLFDMDSLSTMFDLEELRGFGLHEVTGIAPEGSEKPPRSMICCPKCGEIFPAKGNKANV